MPNASNLWLLCSNDAKSLRRYRRQHSHPTAARGFFTFPSLETFFMQQLSHVCAFGPLIVQLLRKILPFVNQEHFQHFFQENFAAYPSLSVTYINSWYCIKLLSTKLLSLSCNSIWTWNCCRATGETAAKNIHNDKSSQHVLQGHLAHLFFVSNLVVSISMISSSVEKYSFKFARNKIKQDVARHWLWPNPVEMLFSHCRSLIFIMFVQNPVHNTHI